ncbi:MAG: nucleotidyltransferase family protein [Pyrinomonadaceae bacterium]
MKQSDEIGLIILAAGASVRFGSAKQLANFKGETLLRRIARESLASVCRPVVVVLGAEVNKSKNQVSDLDVHIIENPDWREGMGSSIKTGLNKLLKINESINGVVLTVCDQPFVTGEAIDKLVETYRSTPALIIASAYQETLGVPALFSRQLFPRLTELKGSGGAKQIIKQFQSETMGVSFPAGAVDIDTPEDFEKLHSQENQSPTK